MPGYICEENRHSSVICALRYNCKYDTCVSVDNAGQIDYWQPYKIGRRGGATGRASGTSSTKSEGKESCEDYDENNREVMLRKGVVKKFVKFELKSDTDLYELQKVRCVWPDG